MSDYSEKIENKLLGYLTLIADDQKVVDRNNHVLKKAVGKIFGSMGLLLIVILLITRWLEPIVPETIIIPLAVSLVLIAGAILIIATFRMLSLFSRSYVIAWTQYFKEQYPSYLESYKSEKYPTFYRVRLWLLKEKGIEQHPWTQIDEKEYLKKGLLAKEYLLHHGEPEKYNRQAKKATIGLFVAIFILLGVSVTILDDLFWLVLILITVIVLAFVMILNKIASTVRMDDNDWQEVYPDLNPSDPHFIEHLQERIQQMTMDVLVS